MSVTSAIVLGGHWFGASEGAGPVPTAPRPFSHRQVPVRRPGYLRYSSATAKTIACGFASP
jgi:hypothetical protein